MRASRGPVLALFGLCFDNASPSSLPDTPCTTYLRVTSQTLSQYSNSRGSSNCHYPRFEENGSKNHMPTHHAGYDMEEASVAS